MLINVELRAFDDSPNVGKPGWDLDFKHAGCRPVNIPDDKLPKSNYDDDRVIFIKFLN